MPGNKRLTKKTIKGKEGLHPGSRKAAQLTRVHLRTDKLKSQNKARKEHAEAKLHRPLFFLHSLSSPHPLTMSSLKALITEVYVTRNDARINELRAERRPGRPKQNELLVLEEFRRKERHEYETGMEVPDLTHAPTVKLMYTWLQSDNTINHSHVDVLRHIRVSPDGETLVTRPGHTEEMGLIIEEGKVGDDWSSLAERAAAGEMAVEA
ncbi:hypothetical protein CI109_102804 [Kwoniella shandongensis]|uniref:Uncharacterized protein n=1 Tax=Kwoniella shandongensis TaxID=1734106 RepID=A0A5M6BMX1_9TREE|nr:uncharacterized protein CI109_007449 [Kwoniella shandongensis]KAA5524224.1 hypothetical protein CI109_007449 [Kwoniella shandongensis]